MLCGSIRNYIKKSILFWTCTRRAGKLYRAPSWLYRNQNLTPNATKYVLESSRRDIPNRRLSKSLKSVRICSEKNGTCSLHKMSLGLISKNVLIFPAHAREKSFVVRISYLMEGTHEGPEIVEMAIPTERIITTIHKRLF